LLRKEFSLSCAADAAACSVRNADAGAWIVEAWDA
jgi:hypothetical protein